MVFYVKYLIIEDLKRLKYNFGFLVFFMGVLGGEINFYLIIVRICKRYFFFKK